MKAHVFTVVVLDFDELGCEEVLRTLEDANFPNDCIHPKVEGSTTYDIGKWEDDHPLNKRDVDMIRWLETNGKKE